MVNMSVPINVLSSANSLATFNGNLVVRGSSSASLVSTQSFNNFGVGSVSTPNLGGGVSVFVDANGGRGTTLSLGNLSVGVGAAVDFSGTGNFSIIAGFTNTDSGGANGMVGGEVTFGGGTSWVASGVTGNVVTPFTAYQIDDFTSKNNVTVTANDAPATFAINSLRFNNAASNTLTIKGLNQIRDFGLGGILITPSVGAHSSAITGGFLTEITSGGGALIVQQYNTSAPFTISSTIISGSIASANALSFAKAGPGTLVLAGANVYGGNTFIDGGTLQVGAGDVTAIPATTSIGVLVGTGTGSGGIGTLDLNGTNVSVGGLFSTYYNLVPVQPGMPGAGGIVTNSSNTAATLILGNGNGGNGTGAGNGYVTFGGSIQDGGVGKAVALTKVGNATEILQGTNTYTGATSIYNGTLALDYTYFNTQKISSTLNLGSTLSLIPSTGGTTQTVATTLNLLPERRWDDQFQLRQRRFVWRLADDHSSQHIHARHDLACDRQRGEFWPFDECKLFCRQQSDEWHSWRLGDLQCHGLGNPQRYQRGGASELHPVRYKRDERDDKLSAQRRRHIGRARTGLHAQDQYDVRARSRRVRLHGRRH